MKSAQTQTAEEILERGRRCFAERAWADAFAALTAADQEAALGTADLALLGLSAGLTGNDAAMLKAQERAHHAHLQADEELPAARVAVWIGFRLQSLGELARSQAWLARAQRIVDRIEHDCVERGYLLMPTITRKLFGGAIAEAQESATLVCEIAERFGDPDLTALGRVLLGRALVRQGLLERGLGLLDDAMLAATSDEVSPIVVGLIYCHVISACTQVYAFDRAREWTAALSTWCDAQPQLVTFTGACIVHRAELMEIGGAWTQCIEEARRATDRPSPLQDPNAVAGAFYQQAEIHRLRGEIEAAETAYERARSAGREPLPGLALLRLAQGRDDMAQSAMRRILATTTDALARTRYLPAHVEIMLATQQFEEARAACVELEQIAASYESEVLIAMANHARAAVLLAEGSPHAAVAPLRSALQVWQRIGAPYIAARIHVLLGVACAALGDHDGARLEHNAARATFEELGATRDLATIDALRRTLTSSTSPPSPDKPRHGLSERELQVLRLVASGKTNRAIAQALFLSEKTVDRHVSNIFAKIEVPSRAAATAFAYEHGLLEKP